MTLLRNILIGIIGVIVLVVVAAYVIVATYDRDALKQMVQDQATEITGRTLTIAGDLDLRVLPTPAITIENVTFSNASWGSRPEMASLKRLDLALDLRALLGGNIRVTRFILVEPEILLETDPDGRPNWDIIAADPNAEELVLPPLAVDSLVIERGNITYRDGPTGDQRTLFLDRLEGSLPEPLSVMVNAKGRVDETPLALDLALKGEGDSFVLSRGEISLGPNTLSGSGSLSLAGARPKVTAQFTSPLLDLSSLGLTDMADEEASDDPADSGAPSRFVFTPDPLPVEGLKTLDLDAKISTPRIKLSETIDVTDATLVLTLDAGDLKVDKLKGAAFGGTVDGGLRLNAATAPAQLVVKVAVKDMNYGSALKNLEISEDVDGTIDMLIDIAGNGGSMREIASGLNGQTQIVAKNGVINNKLLAIFSTGVSDILGPLIGGKKDTSLNCFVSQLDIAAGIAASRVFVLDSSTFSVQGDGTVDLRDESLKLVFDTKTREAALLSLAVPFRVTGTLAEPSAKPDPTAVVKGLAGAAKTLGGLVGKPEGEGGTAKKPGLGGLVKKFTGKADDPAPASEPQAPPKDFCADALRAIGR